MKNSCVGCKYNFRSDKREPCKTGVWNIYYSGECLQYKPSLKTKLKKWLKGEVKQEMTFTIEDADLDKLCDVLKDINVRGCPWFEVQDKHGNKAKYYREPHWIPCSERLPEEDHWLGGSGKQFSDNVLVTIVSRDDEDAWVDVSYTIDGKWALELPRYCKILAWMPLPEHYRGD